MDAILFRMPKKAILPIAAFVGLGLVLGIVLFVYFFSLLRPVSSQASAQRFIVPKGRAISRIGQDLADAGLIRSALAFRVYVKMRGLADNIQAGSFELSPDMDLGEIAIALTQGSEDIWVTVPEGWRVEEIADALAAREELTAFDKDEFLSLAQGSEGYLFPDTYLVPREMTAEAFFNLFTDTFDRKITTGLAKELAASPHSLEDNMIMASIVEREAFDADMPLVAGVLWNRYNIGMALQADATLQYAKGYDASQQSWWVPPLAADKALSSSFNTYLNQGLPPHPIANPGMKAIQATLEPEASDYLFYIHDRQGRAHFATTLEEHNRNIDRYLK